jgi:hypothetical protein
LVGTPKSKSIEHSDPAGQVLSIRRPTEEPDKNEHDTLTTSPVDGLVNVDSIFVIFGPTTIVPLQLLSPACAAMTEAIRIAALTK